MIRDIIQMSYLIVTGGVTLLFFILFNSIFSPKRKAAFLIATCISLLMVICNIFMYLYQDTQSPEAVLYFFTALSYAISGPVVLPFISLSSVISKKIHWLLYVLAAGNAVLSFVSILNGCIFSYDAHGSIILGKLSPIPFYLSAMYITVLLTASILKFRLGFRGESAFLAVLGIATIVAAVMNTAFHFKFLISGMAVLSCIFYYLFITTQTLTRDAMTNALNRHSFYKDIEHLKKRSLILISMDLNGLKQINDTRGHDAGDNAIRTVAKCAYEQLPVRCRLYRMGGDEFEILCPALTMQEAETLTQRIQDAVSAAGYSVAIGCGAYTREMDFETVFNAVDAQMYENKRTMKKAST